MQFLQIEVIFLCLNVIESSNYHPFCFCENICLFFLRNFKSKFIANKKVKEKNISFRRTIETKITFDTCTS